MVLRCSRYHVPGLLQLLMAVVDIPPWYCCCCIIAARPGPWAAAWEFIVTAAAWCRVPGRPGWVFCSTTRDVELFDKLDVLWPVLGLRDPCCCICPGDAAAMSTAGDLSLMPWSWSDRPELNWSWWSTTAMGALAVDPILPIYDESQNLTGELKSLLKGSSQKNWAKLQEDQNYSSSHTESISKRKKEIKSRYTSFDTQTCINESGPHESI